MKKWIKEQKDLKNKLNLWKKIKRKKKKKEKEVEKNIMKKERMISMVIDMEISGIEIEIISEGIEVEEEEDLINIEILGEKEGILGNKMYN